MFKAIGFVVVLVAIRVIMPEVFHGFERTLLTFYHVTERMLVYAPNDVVNLAGASYIPKPNPAYLPNYLR